jgi:hypothetical protein
MRIFNLPCNLYIFPILFSFNKSQTPIDFIKFYDCLLKETTLYSGISFSEKFSDNLGSYLSKINIFESIYYLK